MTLSKVFVVGGTGAQGTPVVRGFVKDNKYAVRVLTRDTESPRAKELLKLPNVELVTGSLASEADLRAGYAGCEYAFINIDGFNTGEKTETFWAIRSYELAIECGIKFFIYGNLDYGYKLSGYDPKFRTGHYDGKGRIAEWILQTTKTNGGRMGAAIFTTGPYIEMALGKDTPMQPFLVDGVVTWRIPIGNGAVPHVSLDDCEYYVRWLLDHQKEANGMDLCVAIEHVNYHEMAKAFTEVTGHQARYEDVSLDTFWSTSRFGARGDLLAGYNSDQNDPASMTIRQNFTGFWNLWKFSGGNQGVIRRDYDLLDRIHPNRIRSVKQWFEKENAKGPGLVERVANPTPVLKIHEAGGPRKL